MIHNKDTERSVPLSDARVQTAVKKYIDQYHGLTGNYPTTDMVLKNFGCVLERKNITEGLNFRFDSKESLMMFLLKWA